MKYVFIINPASGKTDYDKIKQNIMKTLENENYEIYETKAPKEATEIASRFKMKKTQLSTQLAVMVLSMKLLMESLKANAN